LLLLTLRKNEINNERQQQNNKSWQKAGAQLGAFELPDPIDKVGPFFLAVAYPRKRTLSSPLGHARAERRRQGKKTANEIE
jgi:hypothetical protein